MHTMTIWVIHGVSVFYVWLYLCFHKYNFKQLCVVQIRLSDFHIELRLTGDK